jgi:type IV secretion system protein VirD4
MSGLPVGRLIDPSRPSRWAAVAGLFRPGLSARDAVRQFRRAFTNARPPAPAVRLNTSVHTITIAPPGGGKSTGLAVPFLRSCPDSAAVVDVKGELYRLSHRHRLDMGHAVHALDPWRLVTREPATLNPFDWEDPCDPESLDFARDLAESVVVRGQRDEAHWPDMAEVFIGGVAAAVLNFTPPERCHLVTVGNILADRQLLDETVEALRTSAAWDGALARLGHVMTHAGKEEMESILSTSNRMLRWMSSPAAAASLKASSFDPADLTRGRCTVYLIVPAVHLRPMAGLVRLWLSTLHRAVIRGGVRA